MTKLVWDEPSTRMFEAGVDRGVLYFEGGTVAVPWNGLTNVDELFREDAPESYYIDGRRHLNTVLQGDFSGTVKAFTYPDELLEYEGRYFFSEGLSVENQNTKPFDMCYRTLVGNANDGLEHGYKIHILYNVTAVPSDTTHTTLDDQADPIVFSWDLTTVPEKAEGYRPTSHVIIDSRLIHPFLLSDLENLLYGNEEADGSIPSLEELIAFVEAWVSPVIVHDNGDGTWTATGASPYVTVNDGVFVLDGVDGTYLSDSVYELTVNG